MKHFLLVLAFSAPATLANGLFFAEQAQAQYQQTCRTDYLGGYSCRDNFGNDVRVRPSIGPYGGIEARDNYGNRCRRYQDYLGQIVTKCD